MPCSVSNGNSTTVEASDTIHQKTTIQFVVTFPIPEVTHIVVQCIVLKTLTMTTPHESFGFFVHAFRE